MKKEKLKKIDTKTIWMSITLVGFILMSTGLMKVYETNHKAPDTNVVLEVKKEEEPIKEEVKEIEPIEDKGKEIVSTENVEVKPETEPVQEVKPVEPVVQEEKFEQPVEMVVTSEMGVNVRKDNNEKAEVVNAIPYAEPVQVVAKKGEWYKTEENTFVSAPYLMEKNKAIESGAVDMRMSRSGEFDAEPMVATSGRSNYTLADLEVLARTFNLSGTERAALECEDTYNVNASFSYAVARLESGNGTSSIYKDKNNAFGLGAHDSDPYNLAISSTSNADGFYKFAGFIKSRFFDNGIYTLNEISPIYCSSSSWAQQVEELMWENHTIIMNARNKQ